jgi:ketosteroid isomerase-like protein
MIKTMAVLGMIMMTALLISAQNRDRRVEEEIRRANAEEVDGLLRNDIRALGQIWSDDLVVTNPLNKFVNKQEVLQLIESGTLAFASYERRVEYIHLYQNMAVVAGSETVIWAGKMPNAGKTSLLRFTGIWARQNGRWQQVARHANIVVQQT